MFQSSLTLLVHLVVVHTFAHVREAEIRIRVISARAADRQEIRDYEQAPR